MKTLHTLLSELQTRQGIEPDPDQSDLVTLTFEGNITIGLSPAQPDALTLYAHLGDLPQDAAQAAEHLLAANLFWRDTQGATLSLEPYSRGVYLARSVTSSQLPDVQALEEMVNAFAELVARWQVALPSLCEAPAGDRPPADHLIGSAHLA